MKKFKVNLTAISCFSLISYFNTTAQPATCPGELEQYEQICLCYSEPHEQSLWVYYVLDKNEIFLPSRDRLSRFITDEHISTGSATHDDYTHSGYDRGHLSRAMYNKVTDRAYRESYYMSNISPQLPGFNRRGGDWYALEELEISFAKAASRIEAFSGPVFFGNNPERIGSNQVAVPDAFFKAIYIPQRNIEIAFILIHDEKDDDNIWDAAVSVDSLESLINIDLPFDADGLEANNNREHLIKLVEGK